MYSNINIQNTYICMQYYKTWTQLGMKSTEKCGNANTALEEIPITHRIIVTIVMTERLSSTL